MNRTALAISYLDQAHALLTVCREQSQMPPTAVEDALRAVDKAEAIIRRLLDESTEVRQ